VIRITIAVKDILDLQSFEKAEVVAGINGLSRSIQGVSLIEVPESKDMFRDNELYITAFYSIRDNIDLQIATLEKIKDCKAAGICYIDMYIEKLEARVLKFADENNVPIIRVPHHVHYSTMITSIMRKIIQKNERELFQSDQIKNKILKLFRTKSFTEIVNIMEDLSGNPIIYLDREKTVMSNLAKSLSEGFINKIKNLANKDKFDEKMDKYQIDIYPVKHIASDGIIVIIYLKNDIMGNLGIIDFVMQLGRWIIAYQNYNELLSKTEKKQMLNNYYKSLIIKDTPKNELIDKANELGWELSSFFVSVIFYMNCNNSSKYRLYKYENKVKSIFHDRILTIRKKDKIIMFLSIDQDINEIQNAFLHKIENINIYNSNIHNKSSSDHIILMTLGRLKNDISKLKESYFEAKQTLDFGLRLNLNNCLCYWEDVCLLDLLTKGENRSTIDLFIKNMLGDLLQEDFKVYLDTLYVYFSFNEDRQKTSDVLNIHYNTVKYRISKASDILSGEMENNKYFVYLALKLYKTLN